VTFVERGSFICDAGGRELRVEGGGLLWVGPGAPKPIRGDQSRPDVRHINLRFALRRGGRALSIRSLPLVLTRALPTRPAFDELLAHHEAPGPFAQHRLRGLLLGLATACFALTDAGGAEGLQAHQRRHLHRFVAGHLHTAIGPADLARELELSLDYFSRQFRRSYGVPPRTWLVEERMRAAALRLTESEDPVAEVGRYVGVADPNLFTRQFRKVMGCTPGTYRRRGHAPELMTERLREL